MISATTLPEASGSEEEDTKELKRPSLKELKKLREQARQERKQQEEREKQERAAELSRQREEIQQTLEEKITERLQGIETRRKTYEKLKEHLIPLENLEIGIRVMKQLKEQHIVDEKGKIIDPKQWEALKMELEQNPGASSLNRDALKEGDEKEALAVVTLVRGLRQGGRRPPHALFETQDGYLMGGLLKREPLQSEDSSGKIHQENTWTMEIYDYYKSLGKF